MMDDYRQVSGNRYVNIDIVVPAIMRDAELMEFCSLFGTVNSITRSSMQKSYATVQYMDQRPPNVPHTLSDVYKFNLLRTEHLRRNGKFLSDLLKTSVVETKERASRDENQNVVEPSESSSSYLECTYCYSVADFLCGRCRSPYCSTKCQNIDWLKHKKACSKVNYCPRQIATSEKSFPKLQENKSR
ncbi:protein CBFA2T2-like isoform X2 [Sitodiplosis mosellana]|uniref:protein CBFA2T2-like isoform X2 n=1 Tax=Sitodiplosis mosellana TaxID=263140 RepID=UPI002443E3BF|nr:protein CBFA2T2-like isoform X2 [Sitodiplosis mosellana]